MKADTLRIGLLLPYQGPIGLWGLSSEKCAELAAAELNTYKGILGRQVELVPIDASGSAREVTQNTLRMIHGLGLEALVGLHTSDIRVELVKNLKGRIPFIYTPTYEGGENGCGVFMTGETPASLMESMFTWLCENFNTNSWYLVGNDYCWPRTTNSVAKRILSSHGKKILCEDYVPIDQLTFEDELDEIGRLKPDIVFTTLLGECSILFNRQFGERGLHQHTVRYCCAIEENILYGIGANNTQNLFSTMGYHQNLGTEAAENFSRFYESTFGANSPAVNQFSSSCYDGVHLLSHLAESAGSLDCSRLDDAADDGVNFYSSRGESTLQSRHLVSKLHIVQANGVEFQTIK
ncbi:MAG: urea transport system substrate-binding protein [Halioglobus sp.]|jgi:urea transport system substrate-binding protein